MYTISLYNVTREKRLREIDSVNQTPSQRNTLLTHINHIYKPLSHATKSHIITSHSFSTILDTLSTSNPDTYFDILPHITRYYSYYTLHPKLTLYDLHSLRLLISHHLDFYLKSFLNRYETDHNTIFTPPQVEVIFREVILTLLVKTDSTVSSNEFIYTYAHHYSVNIPLRVITIRQSPITWKVLKRKLIHESVHIIRGLYHIKYNLEAKKYSFKFFEEGLAKLSEQLYTSSIIDLQPNKIGAVGLFIALDTLQIPHSIIQSIMRIKTGTKISPSMMYRIRERSLMNMYGLPELKHRYNNVELAYFLGFEVILYLFVSYNRAADLHLKQALYVILESLFMHRLSVFDIHEITFLTHIGILRMNVFELEAYKKFLTTPDSLYFASLIDF